MNIIVVGGGWAGLAAAVELTRAGARVVVLEAARQLGGRARSLAFGSARVDNGQHILLGAYQTVLRLLNTLHISETKLFRRLPLALELHSGGGVAFSLQTPALPAPFHLACGLCRAKGLSWTERLQALRLAWAVQREDFRVEPDVSLTDYLGRHQQSEAIIARLWQPLCLAALNTPPDRASAGLFVQVLRDAFYRRRRDSDLLLPIADLGRCLPEPARDFVEQRGGEVRLGVRVTELEVGKQGVCGIRAGTNRIGAEHIVLATGPRACADLVRGHTALAPIHRQLEQLQAMPICTLYLRYPNGITLGRDFVGVLGTHVQWLFDRGRLTGDDGLIAAVISGPGEHMRLTNPAFVAAVTREIASLFPAWPAPLDTKLVREKHATFAADAGITAQRPPHRTPVHGLWLAGDYTATPYPGTLESAALSGVECARLILNNSEQHYERLPSAS